jgi:phytanoyl-CoA hydroxylase
MTKSTLWLDEVDAKSQILQRAGNDWRLRDIAEALIDVGFVVLKDVHDHTLLDEVRADYDAWIEEQTERAAVNRDPLGRQYRVTNLHTFSKAAMKVGKNPEVMRILDFIFGERASIHTSLTFEYSTEQRLHRDSPYFHTFPHGRFVGVWSALQDIHPDSGPLSYIPGSHRFEIDQHQLFRDALERNGGDTAIAMHEALIEYQNLVEEKAVALGARSYGILNKGDVAIWHPELVHGGSPAVDKSLKRQSMVFHCCPESTGVFVEDKFLTHFDEAPPPLYYDLAFSEGRKHSNFTVPDFMSSI